MASRDEQRDRVIRETQDVAQAMVTCILSGDRDTPADLAQSHFAPEILALVLADLVASVHSAWCQVTGHNDVLDGWQKYLLDVTNWREGNE